MISCMHHYNKIIYSIYIYINSIHVVGAAAELQKIEERLFQILPWMKPEGVLWDTCVKNGNSTSSKKRHPEGAWKPGSSIFPGFPC